MLRRSPQLWFRMSKMVVLLFLSLASLAVYSAQAEAAAPGDRMPGHVVRPPDRPPSFPPITQPRDRCPPQPPPGTAPEPLSLILLGSGMAVAALCWRKVRKNAPR
jgi:hypothetical protein